ncbi:MAG TPA: ABC transporter ATP-binding protein [Armatimonadetes bacterium]|nr:ABC transporter ATP-binding protein/permease [Armatimonadota bacterium]MCA1996077.1 ABC transporter ATP-binding protein/permease [Armatimonadota bacterium]HCE00287.1 ABC transporter ATP-binding protein [Armatimonadota bacterium]
MRSFRRTLQFLRPYRLRVVLAVVFTLVVTVLQILPPRLFQYTIDVVLKPAISAKAELAAIEPQLRKPNPDPALLEKRERLVRLREVEAPRMLLWASVALVGIVVLRNVCSYTLSWMLNWLGHRFCFDLRFATWKHLHRLSLAYHNQTQVGKIMARVTADIELIQGLIQGQLVTFISDVVTLTAVLGMMFWLEWRLATIIVCLIPFYVLSYMAFLKHIREVSHEQRRLWDEMLGKLAEKIAGIAVVKAFVKEDYETENFMSSVRAKFRVDMRQVHLNRRLGLVSGVVSALGTGIVYAYGGKLVESGQMTSGMLVAISFYIGFIFNPAVRVVDFNNTLQWAVAAMDRVFQTLDTRPDVEDKPDAVTLRTIEREILFDNVTFWYVEGKPAVQDVTLRVQHGQIIAIVGHSGAGKTTLMNLLMRFYDPQQGRILIDGLDLRDIKLESLRRHVSMVAQENVLFSVSIMENVKYGNRDATDEQAIAACKAADLHDFIMSLPDGYETMIGEDGIKLSGGQKQRLALARALVCDPKVLILDDVTSALDGETEARVQDALKQVMKGRTTFIIAHRLSSVVDADRIVVMDEGRIVDSGTHEELVARPGIYRDLYEEQFRSALDQVRANA